MEKYYQAEIETAPREQIRKWQQERLLKQIIHVWENVPYYKEKMLKKGVTPGDIRCLEDLHKLPFVTITASLPSQRIWRLNRARRRM